ncbi:acyl dehydratase [Microbacterium ulmi]|nr:acyl dehydratase [Microbacterium ulmi]
MKTLEAGAEIAGARKVATAQRIFWYGSGFMTANAGERREVITNIHTDDEFAREQGFSAAIADGMMSANWISSMLITTFGADAIARGHLRTKFIRPIYVDEGITPRARVISVTRQPDGSDRFELEVWADDDEGVKRTVGDYAVTVDR